MPNLPRPIRGPVPILVAGALLGFAPAPAAGSWAPRAPAWVQPAPAAPQQSGSAVALATQGGLVEEQSAQQPSTEDRPSGPVKPHPEAVEAVGRLKSPFCPGFMLEVCPSPQAAELRDTIEVLARSGMESREIVDWVLARYGEEWRALPKAEGKGLVAWLGPPLAILLGVGVVVLVLARLLRDRSEEDGWADGSPDLSEAEERKLARAVREFDAE